MQQEKLELDTKLLKLIEFVESDKFSCLDAIQQRNLLVQRHIMNAYSQILTARIDYDSEKEKK
jgi:hypothetical protein